MTSNIIHYDFRSTNNPTTVLTNAMLTKGRRKLKTWAGINSVLRTVCICMNFLCIVCSVVSLCWIALLG